MKKIDIKTLLATSSIFLLIAVLTICYYKALPDTVVAHFGVNGEPNGLYGQVYDDFDTATILLCPPIYLCTL